MRATRLRPPRSRAQVRGSWLSLFAMLMIFIGPLISQAMPMDHRMPMPMGMDMSMEMPGQAGEAMALSTDEHHAPQRRAPCTVGKMRLLHPAVQLPGPAADPELRRP